MSKKTLLNETQVRRFMKLANVGALTDGFVDGLNEAGYFTGTEEPTIAEEEEEALEDELPGDEGPADELDMAADVGGEEDLEADLDLGAEEGDLDDAAGESLPPEVVSQVEDALAAALGAMEQELESAIPELDLSVEQDGGAEDDLAALDAEEPALDAEEPALDAEEPALDAEEPALDAEAGEDELALQENELVERIVKRVASRLRNVKNQ